MIQWRKEVLGAGRVMCREIQLGRANSNPIIDNQTYEVEFGDGSMIN